MSSIVVRNGYVYLSKSTWDPVKKACVSKNVRSFGKLKALLEKDPEGLNKLKAQYNDVSSADVALEDTLKLLAVKPTSSKDVKPVLNFPSLNYAHYLVRQIWDGTLDLSRLLKRCTDKAKVTFDAKDILFYGVVCKLVDPASNLANYLKRVRWVGDPIGNVDQQHMYRALDFAYKHRDRILKQVHRRLVQTQGRDLSLVFYDVTNTYFETPYDDQEKFDQAFAKAVAAKGAKATQEDIEKIREQMTQEFSILKMRGPSKEHRFDMPIVSIALVVDRDGIPIDYRVYAGNASEKVTMHASIQALSKQYGITNAMVVADKGLNTADNMKDLQDNDHGCLLSQSISMLSAEKRAEILDDKGWVKDAQGQRWYKEVELIKKAGDGTEITCRLVVAWSKKRYDREMHRIEAKIRCAQAAVAENKDLKSQESWRPYVCSSKVHVKSLNQQRIDKDKQLAGYYGYVFCDSVKRDTPVSAEEVIAQYHCLEKIEECFRIMKHSFHLRPVYVSNPNRIEAVVLFCVLALIVLRVMAKKAKSVGLNLSTDNIIEALQSAQVTAIHVPNTDSFLYLPSSPEKKQLRSDDDVIDLTEENDLHNLMRVLELTPIPGVVDKNQLAQCLATRFDKDRDVIGSHFKFS